MKLALCLVTSLFVVGCSIRQKPLPVVAAPAAPQVRLAAAQSISTLDCSQYSYPDSSICYLAQRVCQLEQKLAPVWFETLPGGGIIAHPTYQSAPAC